MRSAAQVPRDRRPGRLLQCDAVYYDAVAMSEPVQSLMQASTATRETVAESDAGFLWDFWYPALRSREVTGNHLKTAMLLEVPLVLGRTAEGNAFAMRDSCPHRGIPLSYGRFDGKTVECSYHGWKFEACSGQCVEIPSLTSQDKLKVERIFAGHYPCEEWDGYFWVYMNSVARIAASRGGEANRGEEKGNAEVQRRGESLRTSGAGRVEEGGASPSPTGRVGLAVTAPPKLSTFSEKYRITHLACELPSHVDQGIIGLMDPAHGPFVHQSWYWRSRHSIHEKEKKFEPIPNGFRMSPHTPSSNSAPYRMLQKYTGEPVTTTIDFVLPNIRTEEIRSGKLWFSSRATVTPVRRDLCRIDFVAAWNLLLPVWIFRIFAQKFLRQDQETMILQAEGLKHNPRLMLIDDADRPAKWYFGLKAGLLESRRTGVAMVHPMPGPVTLHWRS
jgi:phenylpropionate dioxygenase-like ring-hydroxylating dioxygenase large terminal subunit